MLRPIALCSVFVRSFHRQVNTRILPVISATTQQRPHVRNIQLSTCRTKDEQKKPRNKRTKTQTTSKSVASNIDAEMRDATVKVAKSLPGEWTKTAEELLERLQMQQTQDAEQSLATDSPETKEETGSLLSSMKVGRSFEPSTRRGKPMNERMSEDAIMGKTGGPTDRAEMRKRLVRKRLPETFKSLDGAPRLGIFDVEKLSKETGSEGTVAKGLWEQVDAEHVSRIKGGLPRNAFEEMIEWTKQGKMWVFPVDNEADLHEERKYKFHDHVFLEKHLGEFPDKGPIRKFMELVVLGLSKNPWLTVPEKVEHIDWFAQYFREKQDILETSIGEDGRMKENKKQLE